jgi:hypothetical protein
MGARLGVTAAWATVGAVGAYAEQKQIDLYSQGTYDFLHALPVELTFLVCTVAVGFVVGRWWVTVALIGPLLSLGYLQVTGYISPWHDGVAPLLSLPALADFVWFALLLLLGVGIRRLGGRSHAGRPEQPHRAQSGTGR